MSEETFKKAYEALRTKLSQDIPSLILEQQVTIREVAKRLNISEKELLERIHSEDLKLSQLVRILDSINVDLYPILRARIWEHKKPLESNRSCN